jgi:hypothetical protein
MAASASLDFRHLTSLNLKPLSKRRRNPKPSQGYGRLPGCGCYQFVRISLHLGEDQPSHEFDEF